jgi:purine-binding chemotaxis protein CheW
MKRIALESEEKDKELILDEDYMVFRIASDNYGIKIRNIKKLLKKGNILSVHGAPEYFIGLTSVNGEIYPVFDLKRKLSLENSEKYGKFSVIAILDMEQENLAIIADAVLDIYRISPKDMKKAVASKNEKILTPYEVNYLDFEIKIIDLKKLFELKNLH